MAVRALSYSALAFSMPLDSVAAHKVREKHPAQFVHRPGMKMARGWSARERRSIMMVADAWRPDLGRWISTPWEKPVRAVFRNHRMSRPAYPASTWANLCLLCLRRRVCHHDWRQEWKQSLSTRPGL